MKIKDNMSLAFSGVLVVCALVITSLVIRQEFFPSESEPKIRQVKDWQQLELKGQQVGLAEAPVQIVEFFDYQCPFCKSVQPHVKAVQQKYPSKISVIHEHFPLSGHEYAFEAAVAAECAGHQKRFSEYHDLLFAHQDQLGKLRYDSLASEAGISDVDSFATCLESKQTSPTVQSGLDLAKELDLTSIPTFVVNGKLISGALSQQQLEVLVEEALAE